MKEQTLIQLGRAACGTAILITHMVTGANSTFVILGVVLLGLPMELLQRGEKQEES